MSGQEGRGGEKATGEPAPAALLCPAMTSISVFGDAQQALQLLRALDKSAATRAGLIWDEETINPDHVLRLTLSTARVTSLVPLYNCSFRSLTQLNLSFNRITDISHLAHLHALRLLDISHNRIVSIDSLRKMGKLAVLRCHHNSIEVLEPLMGLSQLEELWLSDNKIDWAEFIHLLPLVNLNHLVKMNNPCDAKPKMDSFIWGLCASLVTLDGMEISAAAEGEGLVGVAGHAVEFFKSTDGKVMFAQAKSQLTPALRAQLQPFVERISMFAEAMSDGEGAGANSAATIFSSEPRRPTGPHPRQTGAAINTHHLSPARQHTLRTQDDASILSSPSRRPAAHARQASPGRRPRVQHFKAQRNGMPRKFVPDAPQQQGNESLFAAQAPLLSLPLEQQTENKSSMPLSLSPKSGERQSPRPFTLDMEAAKRLFSQMDRHGNNAVTLRDLVFTARDSASEGSRLLHELLQLPSSVHQEGDASRDAIVRLFAALHGQNGELKQGVSFDEFVSYMTSHHFLGALESELSGVPAQQGPGGVSAAQLLAITSSAVADSSPSPQVSPRGGPVSPIMAAVPVSRTSPPKPRGQAAPASLSGSPSQLQPMYSQVVRFGEDESAPVALCLQSGGSGYARWSKNGPVACSFENGRIFSSYRGGAIAVVLDREGNGSVMDTRGKCVLLVNASGTAKVMDKTGRVLSEERRGVAGTGSEAGAEGDASEQPQSQTASKWTFDGLSIEWLPASWEIVVRFQNDRVACEFSSVTGGRLLRDKKADKANAAAAASAAASAAAASGGATATGRAKAVNMDELFDHAGIQSVSSGLDSILGGLKAANGGSVKSGSSKIPRAVKVGGGKGKGFR